MIDAKIFGERIRLYRSKIGLTQTELAQKIHVSFQAVSNWERGNVLPDLENLCVLAETLGVSIDALVQKQVSSEERVFIGIDGGGTSTEFALFTSQGHILKCFKLSGSNASTIGLSSALAIFYTGIDRCLAVNNSVQGIFMGCAGSLFKEITENLSEYYPNIPIYIDSDGVNALLSADGDAAMICGTGMVFLSHDKNGGYRKFAGWGHDFGDFGSAYNFGRAAICEALAFEDGLDASPLIYSLLKQKTGASKIRGVLNVNADVAKIAEFASVIFDAYSQNDHYAKDIIHNEERALARIVKSVCPNGGKIIACGGINRHFGNITLPILKEYIPKNIEFILPKLPPIYGACREACRRFSVQVASNFFENFEADYNNLI
ncbi:MAG: XRE family transcriptional regulator [Ruminococcaceae bacterium]|nr:XRE family transcriptional regulator [Oscillospiraceae bacterium]